MGHYRRTSILKRIPKIKYPVQRCGNCIEGGAPDFQGSCSYQGELTDSNGWCEHWEPLPGNKYIYDRPVNDDIVQLRKKKISPKRKTCSCKKK